VHNQARSEPFGLLDIFSTSMASSAGVTFIEEDPARSRSTRQRNLRISAVKSHAASHIHDKKRKKKHAAEDGYWHTVTLRTSPTPSSYAARRVLSVSSSASSDESVDAQVGNILFSTAIDQHRSDPFSSQALRALGPLINQVYDKSG
jgi:hypothetical protein